MPKITVTYKAPKGDSKVTEIFGHTFFDGKPESIDVDDREAEKLKGHPLFTVGEGHDKPDPKADLKDHPKDYQRSDHDHAKHK
jgi:hypothetical protein